VVSDLARPAARRLVAALATALLAGALPAPARADTEPPPDAPEGADYVLEPADSVRTGDVDLDVGVSGHGGSGTRMSRRLRYDDGELAAGFRDGAGDPLAGSAVQWRVGGGVLAAGRLAPRWGEGLVLGAAGEPWSRAPLDRGDHTAWRGRAGAGVLLTTPWRAVTVDAVAARFSHRALAGARLATGAAALGVLAGPGGAREASVSCAASQGSGELAVDARGRWRAAATRREALGRWRMALSARGGATGFQSLAEPRRSGPAQAGSITLAGRERARGLSLLGAWWRWRAGVSGARAALEVERRMAHHDVLAAGVEEQHGARRDPAPRSAGLRQGVWLQWQGGSPGLGVTMRAERWGARPFARAAVRTLSLARVDAHPAGGVGVGIERSVWHTSHAEGLYLAEAGADRVVLRAVTGAGARTRVDITVPGARGRVRASAAWTDGVDRARPQWRIDWIRSSRAPGRRAGAPSRGP
jgi:hypothetical protein